MNKKHYNKVIKLINHCPAKVDRLKRIDLPAKGDTIRCDITVTPMYTPIEAMVTDISCLTDSVSEDVFNTIKCLKEAISDYFEVAGFHVTSTDVRVIIEHVKNPPYWFSINCMFNTDNG